MAAYYQCPGCGSILQDDPESLVITCKNCGSTITKTEQTDYIVKMKTENRIAQIENRKMAMAEREQEHQHKSSKSWWLIMAVITVIFAAVIIFTVVLPHSNKVKELERLVIEIEQDISNGDYDTALVKTNRVRLDDDFSSDENEKWNKEREYLIEMINDLKNGS